MLKAKKILTNQKACCTETPNNQKKHVIKKEKPGARFNTGCMSENTYPYPLYMFSALLKYQAESDEVPTPLIGINKTTSIKGTISRGNFLIICGTYSSFLLFKNRMDVFGDAAKIFFIKKFSFITQSHIS